MFPHKPDGQTDIRMDISICRVASLRKKTRMLRFLESSATVQKKIWKNHNKFKSKFTHYLLLNIHFQDKKILLLLDYCLIYLNLLDLVVLVTSWGSSNDHSSFSQVILGQVRLRLMIAPQGQNPPHGLEIGEKLL